MKNLYRYEIMYGSEYGETDVFLRELEIVRKTELSYFIKLPYNKLKRVSKNARKSYAYDTKERALHNFYLRTNRRILYLDFYKSKCKEALKIAKRKYGTDKMS